MATANKAEEGRAEKSRKDSLRSVELFAGAGGLALGCAKAGFQTSLMVEWDKWACDTVRQNQNAGFPLVRGWKIYEGDVRSVNWNMLKDPVDLVSGGPPCQPFSMGGKHKAHDDKRDMFPATTEVISELQPRVFIIENVKGLTRNAFANYFSYIQLRLKMPYHKPRTSESWYEHYKRLQTEDTSTKNRDLRYNLTTTLVNAANYGVAQQRHRIFMVGFRSDIKERWMFPEPTHSKDALLYDQWVSGKYWERHKIVKRFRPPPPSKTKIAALKEFDTQQMLLPWQTVRDAFVELPEPTTKGSTRYKNHTLKLGARTYPGHTGSLEDLPAKTLKAGTHGVPGGENMVRYNDGTVRYFTVRESARLQTFPDTYEFYGSWGETMRQLGNAVPVKLAHTIAQSVASHLYMSENQAETSK